MELNAVILAVKITLKYNTIKINLQPVNYNDIPPIKVDGYPYLNLKKIRYA